MDSLPGGEVHAVKNVPDDEDGSHEAEHHAVEAESDEHHEEHHVHGLPDLERHLNKFSDENGARTANVARGKREGKR